MSDQPSAPVTATSNQPTIIINNVPSSSSWQIWLLRAVLPILAMSLLFNMVLIGTSSSDSGSSFLVEHVSGDESSKNYIAIISISGTIMPPFTERTLDMIKLAEEDEHVKGVILSIDSPGGFVADSHQIYHRLKKLSSKKPIYVSMKRMAASGGVYVAMGVGEKGKIFAEPTTWTGSIGVIIPRYDFSKLADKFGVTSDSLTTGPFKDSMNPFKPLGEAERALWGEIMDDSFDRFVKIVDEGRAGLNEETVRTKLATGQVFTAQQALKNGLIDGISFEDEVATTLQKDLQLESAQVVRFTHQPTLVDLVLGDVKSRQPDVWERVLEASVPRAMYYCSWLP